jgi:hypothetical protein
MQSLDQTLSAEEEMEEMYRAGAACAAELDKEEAERQSREANEKKEEKARIPGKVYIISLPGRGKGRHIEPPAGCLKLNVTSGQATLNKNRRDFSPMTFVDGSYKGFANFEAYWQSGKVFREIDEEKAMKFWKGVGKAKKSGERGGPKRRYPGSKGKEVLYAKFPGFENQEMDYVTSRKEVYVPLYEEMIKGREMTLYWKEVVAGGRDVAVYDFDGPRLEDGRETGAEVTMELLKEKINNTRFPFGHGYVVAAYIAGHDMSEIIKK